MVASWVRVCKTEDILPYSGVAALVLGRQVAVFRLQDEYYAISDYDPFSGMHMLSRGIVAADLGMETGRTLTFSGAYVLSRGIVGDRGGVVKVVSPIYKQSFSLLTGECLDEPTIKLAVYPVQVMDDVVYIAIKDEKANRYTFQTVVPQRQSVRQLYPHGG